MSLKSEHYTLINIDSKQIMKYKPSKTYYLRKPNGYLDLVVRLLEKYKLKIKLTNKVSYILDYSSSF